MEGEVPIVAPDIDQINELMEQLSVGVTLGIVTDEEQAAAGEFAVIFVGHIKMGKILSTLIVASEDELEQGLFIVQRKTFAPEPKDVTEVVGDDGEAILPNPETNVQLPVPDEGVLPDNVAVLEQTF